MREQASYVLYGKYAPQWFLLRALEAETKAAQALAMADHYRNTSGRFEWVFGESMTACVAWEDEADIYWKQLADYCI